jgi:hypothetical protein
MDRTFPVRVKWQHSWKKSSVIFCKDSQELVSKIQDMLPNAEVRDLFICNNNHSPYYFFILHVTLCIDIVDPTY